MNKFVRQRIINFYMKVKLFPVLPTVFEREIFTLVNLSMCFPLIANFYPSKWTLLDMTDFPKGINCI